MLKLRSKSIHCVTAPDALYKTLFAGSISVLKNAMEHGNEPHGVLLAGG
jgi:hypothetical protein